MKLSTLTLIVAAGIDLMNPGELRDGLTRELELTAQHDEPIARAELGAIWFVTHLQLLSLGYTDETLEPVLTARANEMKNQTEPKISVRVPKGGALA